MSVGRAVNGSTGQPKASAATDASCAPGRRVAAGIAAAPPAAMSDDAHAGVGRWGSPAGVRVDAGSTAPAETRAGGARGVETGKHRAGRLLRLVARGGGIGAHTGGTAVVPMDIVVVPSAATAQPRSSQPDNVTRVSLPVRCRPSGPWGDRVSLGAQQRHVPQRSKRTCWCSAVVGGVAVDGGLQRRRPAMAAAEVSAAQAKCAHVCVVVAARATPPPCKCSCCLHPPSLPPPRPTSSPSTLAPPSRLLVLIRAAAPAPAASLMMVLIIKLASLGAAHM